MPSVQSGALHFLRKGPDISFKRESMRKHVSLRKANFSNLYSMCGKCLELRYISSTILTDIAEETELVSSHDIYWLNQNIGQISSVVPI